MPTVNRLAWFARAALVIGCGSMLVGCGGIGGGDFVIYRVALAQTAKKSGCFGPNGPDANTKFDTDDHVDIATWEITAAPNDVYDLNGYTVGLSGSKIDGGYEFKSTKKNVDYANDDFNSNHKETITDTWDIPITTSGAEISGTITHTQKHTCTGDGCPVDGFPTCTETNDFVGTKINDVQLYHDPAK
jgi:hypothetical protein